VSCLQRLLPSTFHTGTSRYKFVPVRASRTTASSALRTNSVHLSGFGHTSVTLPYNVPTYHTSSRYVPVYVGYSTVAYVVSLLTHTALAVRSSLGLIHHLLRTLDRLDAF
jgi:hypothetical protein